MSPILGVLLGMSLCVQPAEAVEGLAWNWDGARRFLLINDVNAPEYLLFQAEKNHQARVFKWRTNLVLSCTAEPIGRRAHLLNCDIEDISLQAQALPGDEGSLPAVLQDMDAKLTAASLQIEMTTDGRVRGVDLKGIEKKHRRMNEIIETLRLVMTRAVSALDLQLPKKGDDGGQGQWIQKQTLVTAFPATMGTLGSVKTLHEIEKSDDQLVVIQTVGRGVSGSGRMIEVAGQEQIANLYEVQYAGQATFDIVAGSLMSREFQFRGTATVSSEMSGAWKGMPYLQYGKLQTLGDSEHPNLGVTRVLESESNSP